MLPQVPTPFGMRWLDGLVEYWAHLSEVLFSQPSVVPPWTVPDPSIYLTLAAFPKASPCAMVYQREFGDASPWFAMDMILSISIGGLDVDSEGWALALILNDYLGCLQKLHSSIHPLVHGVPRCLLLLPIRAGWAPFCGSWP